MIEAILLFILAWGIASLVVCVPMCCMFEIGARHDDTTY